MRYLFEDFALDTDRRELRRGAEAVPIPMEPQVFDLLVYLIRNRERVVSRDDLLASVWQGRIVSESALNTRIHLARSAIGDNGEDQRLIRTWPRKGIRFVGAIREASAVAPSQARAVEAAVSNQQAVQPPAAQPLRQQIRFCTTADRVRIAYSTVGNGPPLVRAAHWLNHLEHDWRCPITSPVLREFAAGRRLVRYDGRGNGLSDWEVGDISFEGFLRDLESVVDASGLDRFALLGMSQGAPISVAYAARHPERVSHLVIYGGYARGRRTRAAPHELEHVDAMVTLMRQGWGQDNPAFRQLWTSHFLPGGTAEQMQSFNDLQRITTSPENAMRMRQAMDVIDVDDLLRHVKAATLVVHCRGDAVAPFEEGRRLAAGIPGACFVALEGGNHFPLQSDPTWSRIFDEINTFLQPRARTAGLRLVGRR